MLGKGRDEAKTVAVGGFDGRQGEPENHCCKRNEHKVDLRRVWCRAKRIEKRWRELMAMA